MLKVFFKSIFQRIKLFRQKIRKLKGIKKILAYTGISIFLFFFFLFLIDINFLWLFGKSPKISQLNNPDFNIASEIYSSDSVLLGKYFLENRSPVTFEEISPVLINTLIATEDVRFYQHFGIDIKATFAIFKSLLQGERRGGSTITQQLVKNLFKTRTNYSKGLLGYIPGVKTIFDKLKEWISAIKIEIFYTKNEILTMYLNTVDFGSNSFGIKSASRTYFNVLPSELTVDQSATLIGMLKAPTLYSPVLNPENCIERRNTVFGQLYKYGVISENQLDSLTKLQIELDYNVSNNYDGEASYFREAVANYLKQWCKENNINIYTDGLKIFTTLDSRLQRHAENAMKKQMTRLQKRFFQHWENQNPWQTSTGEEIPDFIENLAKEIPYYHHLVKRFENQRDSIDYYLNKPRKMKVFTWNGEQDTTFSFFDSIRYYVHILNAGFITYDPFSGYVKTWVGGIDFKHFKYDHVRQSKRQPGSLFKAFVYSAAIEEFGFGPCDSMVDRPITINYVENGMNKSWSPHNADWIFSEHSMTLKHAFAKSVNSIAVQITDKIGWKKVIEYAHKLGIKSKLKDVPSVCLGSSNVSLFELVNSFCCFVNGGYYVEPILVTKIIDKNGKIIYEAEPTKSKVLSDESAFLMQQMFRAGLTEPGGTTQALFEHDLFRYDTELGGKTGTSSDHSDGWFIGISPNLVSGSWVGNDHQSVHFRTSDLGEGCKTALPIYGFFMENVLKDTSLAQFRQKFPKPSCKITKSYTCHTKYIPNDTLKEVIDSLLPENQESEISF